MKRLTLLVIAIIVSMGSYAQLNLKSTLILKSKTFHFEKFKEDRYQPTSEPAPGLEYIYWTDSTVCFVDVDEKREYNYILQGKPETYQLIGSPYLALIYQAINDSTKGQLMLSLVYELRGRDKLIKQVHVTVEDKGRIVYSKITGSQN